MFSAFNRGSGAFILAALGAFASSDAAAEAPLSGLFVAREACPALQSIRKETNPGDVRTEPGKSYPLLAKNKPAASHYLIQIQGADPARRWVAVGCGESTAATGAASSPEAAGAAARRPAFVLAASWQPAFCAIRREKRECRSEDPQGFGATHFTLHGLWPQPESNSYCGVSPDLKSADRQGDWQALPAPELSQATRGKLDTVMPGLQSGLERHEWIRHGTCFHAPSADAYFSRAVALIEQLNGSKAREIFAANVGRELSGKAIRAAFDASFGAGAGERVRLSCRQIDGRRAIVELTIGLKGEIGDDPSLTPLIAASEPTDPGCPGGIVEAAGR